MNRVALLVVLAAAACKDQGSAPAPQPSSVRGVVVAASASEAPPANPCALDAARLAELHEKVHSLRPGMTAKQVDATLGLDFVCFPASGEGGDRVYAVAYRVAPKTSLALTWDRADGGNVLVNAAVRDEP